MPSQTFTASGTFNVPAGVTQVQCQAWGPGGTGAAGNGFTSGGGGGGGGEFAAENSLSVTSGGTLTITISAGSSTTVTGGGVTVTAHAGGNASGTSAGAAGTGSTNSVHHNGGAGASAQAGGTGGGGGSSGGTSAAGNPGSGNSGGTAPSGGGNGGNGAATTSANGTAGSAPGGGGGGGGTSGTGASGAGGQVIITWAAPPSGFSPPATAKGRPAAVRGTGKGSPRTPVTIFNGPVFQMPRKPARGAQAAARGHSESVTGKFTAPPPPTPSPFTLPVRPARGAQAAVRGHSTSSPGAVFVPFRISPFTLPARPAQGRSAVRRGKGWAGSATGQGAPFVPRKLIVAAASQAGTDDYGNPFPQGLLAAMGLIQGPQIVAAGTGSEYLAYNGTPAAGNLVASVAAQATTDAHGNAVLQGITTYSTTVLSGKATAMAVDGGTVAWYYASTQAGPYTLFMGFGLGISGSNQGSLFISAGDSIEFGQSAGLVWNDVLQQLQLVSGTVITPALTVNGVSFDIPQSPPGTVPAAPTSYNQTWGTGIVTILNQMIAALGNAGIW